MSVIRNICVVIIFVTILNSCGTIVHKKDDCSSRWSGDLKSLVISGGRTRSNVVYEIWELQCRMRTLHDKDYPDVHGSVTITFTAEYTGELYGVKIVKTDIEDFSFLEKVTGMFDYVDFTFWGTDREETLIMYTFKFD